LTAFPHITLQSIREIAEAPKRLDPTVDWITDFDYPEENCDPHGMSGCGAWSIPQPKEAEIWSARKSQLLGILIGHYQESKLLQFLRIERVLRLSSYLNRKHRIICPLPFDSFSLGGGLNSRALSHRSCDSWSSYHGDGPPHVGHTMSIAPCNALQRIVGVSFPRASDAECRRPLGNPAAVIRLK
jgi:hypothetical protein